MLLFARKSQFSSRWKKNRPISECSTLGKGRAPGILR
jgi:hypothetical protein